MHRLDDDTIDTRLPLAYADEQKKLQMHENTAVGQTSLMLHNKRRQIRVKLYYSGPLYS